MIYYIDSRSVAINEYLAENCEYIGMLGSKTEQNITPADISLEKINARLAKDEFLVCCIMNSTWWICILFNNPDGAREIKENYKGKIMLWYWIKRDTLKQCMHHMQYKSFARDFPEKRH